MGLVDMCRDHEQYCLSKTTHRMNQLFGLTFLMGWRSLDGGSWTHLRTTDIPPPGKNNIDSMNQLAG